MVNGIINEAGDLAVQTVRALEHQLEEIVLEPLNQVEAMVQSIEERAIESEECVAAEEHLVAETVDNMHSEMISCGVVAAQESAQIATDVTMASKQLVFDGYEVLALYNKCRNYKNSVLKNSCYARLSIKATLYMNNARKSIKTIKGAKGRVPEVFTSAETCTNTAAEEAVLVLENVHNEIDACINKLKN